MKAHGVALVTGFVLVAFAFNSIITRHLVADGLLDPASVTVVRFFAAAGALIAVALAKGGGRRLAPTRADLWPAVALGAYALLIAYGYQYITVAAGTFVFYALVLATMTGAGAWMERRPPSPRATVGGLAALSGVAFLAVGRVAGTTTLGVILLAGTGIAWAAYSLAQRRQTNALEGTARGFIALALWLPGLFLVAWLTGGVHFSGRGLWLALLMGLLNTGGGYVAWTWVLSRITNTQAATYQLLIPVIGAGAGVLLLGEPLTWQLMAAGTLVLVGMRLATPR